MTACSAPEIPPDLWIQQGWREADRGMWIKQDGTPVFMSDIVRIYKPLADWFKSMAGPSGPTLADFEEAVHGQ